MKKLIFGVSLFIGGILSTTAVICSSLLSNDVYAPVLINNNVKLPLNIFMIITITGLIISYKEAFKENKS